MIELLKKVVQVGLLQNQIVDRLCRAPIDKLGNLAGQSGSPLPGPLIDKLQKRRDRRLGLRSNSPAYRHMPRRLGSQSVQPLGDEQLAIAKDGYATAQLLDLAQSMAGKENRVAT